MRGRVGAGDRLRGKVKTHRRNPGAYSPSDPKLTRPFLRVFVVNGGGWNAVWDGLFFGLVKTETSSR